MHSKTHFEPLPQLRQQTIGRYDIIYPLASGGMATIYVGRLSGMAGFEKLVTLKLIHSHLATQREFVDMFLDEARLAAKIHHPNIGEIYEIVEDGGQLFIAAEFVAGHNLSQLLQTSREFGRPISHSIASWICAEVCQGIDVVHNLTDDDGRSLNLVHRDISPSNILLSYSGYVKLIDFGVAFAESRLAHTIPGNIKGKVGYISPEQLKGVLLDRRADIFALGVILYQSVTGQHPFFGKDDAERLRKTINYELNPPSVFCPTIDTTLENIILKALAEAPDHRYRDAAGLERDLRQYIADKGEITGASDIARVMQTLFANTKVLHQERISEFKRNTPIPPSRYRLSDSFASSADSGKGETAVSPPAVPGKKSREMMRFSGRELGGFAVIGGIVSSLFTAGILFLFSGETPTAPQPQTKGNEAVDPLRISSEQTVAPPKEPAPLHGETTAPDAVATPEDDAAARALLIEISVSLEPKETALFLDGKVMEIDAGSIRLPADGKRYEIVAMAPNYVAKTYAIVPEKGATLSVVLLPNHASLPPQSRKIRNPKHRATGRGMPGKPSTRVLKRNPY